MPRFVHAALSLHPDENEVARFGDRLIFAHSAKLMILIRRAP